MAKVYYEDGQVQLWHGDCRDVLPTLTLPPESTAVVTDPPYGIDFDFTKKRPRGKTSLAWGKNPQPQIDRDWSPLAGDDRPFDPTPLLSFLQVILWGANNYAHLLPPSQCWLVWDKRRDTAPDSFSDCELAWTNLPGTVRKFSHLWRGLVREGEENVARSKKFHPCQKPVALMGWCISKTQGLVLDPYAGSGTTLRAAKNLGRKAIGVELDERYCEIAANRLAQNVLAFE